MAEATAEATAQARLHITIKGEVQGVFFRDYVRKAAGFLKLSGWVRNTNDGNVEVLAEGKKKALEQLLEKCKKGPAPARVKSIDSEWQAATGEFEEFEIRY